jgi:4'-phosphopantetheinyl transferase
MVSQAFQTILNHVPDGATITWPCVQPGSAFGRSDSSGLALRRPQAQQVHIWAVWLDASPPIRAAYQKTLSAPELERASRFHFEEHRNRYIVAHGWLRQLLAAYLGLPAAALDFDHATKGKPALAGPVKASELQFNLAHSDNLSLVAVTHRIPVGIDVERVRPLDDAEQLVARFFSKQETSRFRSLPAAQKSAAFFNLWTRKEAWLKATGEGITHLLGQVEVSFLAGEPARLLSLPSHFPDASNWSLGDLNPAPGFAAAFALAAPGAEPECRAWDHELTGSAL